MGHRGYSGNHPRFSKRADERYDAKEAYNKDLTASARLHYLENVRHDHDSPADMHCSPMRMHTDAHMRRQAKKIAKRTKGDEQDIYYEMKSKKMSEKKAPLNQNDKPENPKLASLPPRDNIDKFTGRTRGKKKDVRPLGYATDPENYNRQQEKKKYLEQIKKRKRLSPVRMEGKGCAKSEGGSGCVVKRGDEYVILNNKKGGIFQSGFKSKQAAERSLAGYHANK